MEKKRRLDEITKENNKEFVKDGITTIEIKKIIKNIRIFFETKTNKNIDDKKKIMEQEYKFFSERYPILFDLATRETFNNEYLDYFLNMRENVVNDKVSADEASKEIGEVWFNKFVDKTKMEKK